MTINSKNSFVQSAGTPPQIEAIDVVALYDPKDGRVAHLHRVLTFAGAERRATQDQLRSAIDSARRLGRDVDALEAAFQADAEPGAAMYRVDLTTKALAQEPAPRTLPGKAAPGSASGF